MLCTLLVTHNPIDLSQLRKFKELYYSYYLVDIRCSLQTNQILHEGSAFCMTATAVLDLGIFIFLKFGIRKHHLARFMMQSTNNGAEVCTPLQHT